jgi:FlaA1/EpsC-like NDP-sugar epimerase
VVVLTAAGISKTIWRFSGLSEYSRLVSSCVAVVLVSVLIGFATLRLENVPRSLPVIQAIVMIALMVGVRVVMRARRLQRRNLGAVSAVPAAQETVLVVGLNAVAELFIQALAERAEPKIAIAGVIGRNERHTGQLFRGYPILGTPEDIVQVLSDLEIHGVTVDRIVVTLPVDRISNATHSPTESQ